MSFSLKWRVLFGIVIVGAVAAIWTMQRDAEPVFEGKTATQWFDGEVAWWVSPPSSRYLEAVDQLHTNFIPVFVRARPNLDLTLQRLKYQWNLPQWMRRFIPEQRLDWYRKAQAIATQSILHQKTHWNETELILKELLFKERNEWKQDWLWVLVSCRHLEPGSAAMGLMSPEFLVRLHAAVVVADSANRNDFGEDKKALAAPVLLEAVTNATMMAKTFGGLSEKRRAMAFNRLKIVAPETASRHSKYSK